MTQSLTERLQEKLAHQMAEIEALTSAALKELAANLKRDASAELRNMHRDIRETVDNLETDLIRVRRISRWWWVGLLVTWIVVGGYSTWRSLQIPTPKTAGIALYQSFEHEGRTYLLLPEETEALTCRSGARQMPCMLLPVGE